MDLSPQEIREVKNILSKQTPGFLPYDLLISLAKLIVIPIIELIPLCKDNEGNLKVLLLQREETDPFWPNMFHTPGTLVRTDDEDSLFKEGFERLKKEIGITDFIKAPKHFKSYYRTSSRSKEVAICYWVEIDDLSEINGKWFDLYKLPENLVAIQFDLIRDAVENFKIYNS